MDQQFNIKAKHMKRWEKYNYEAITGAPSRPGNGMKRVAISFDDELLSKINEIVVNEQISFAKAVRRLCKIGLENT